MAMELSAGPGEGEGSGSFEGEGEGEWVRGAVTGEDHAAVEVEGLVVEALFG